MCRRRSSRAKACAFWRDPGQSAKGYAYVEQALEVLSERTVDLILLDLHMPGLYDGEELLFLLRDRGDDA